MSRASKNEHVTAAPAGAAFPGPAGAYHAEPGSREESPAPHAQPRRASRRALDTGTRGWRWLVTSVVFLVLPLSLDAGEPAAMRGPGAPAATAGGTLSLAPVAGDLELGVRLATLDGVRAELHRMSRFPAADLHWAEVYFDAARRAPHDRSHGALPPISGTVAVDIVGPFEPAGRI